MTVKLMGALLVVAGCGGFGFSMAAAHRREETQFRQYLRVLEWMTWELSFRGTPLPQLCRCCAQAAAGPVGQLFDRLAQELEQQILSDAALCMHQALKAVPGLSCSLRTQAEQLGEILGRFDLQGQLQGLESAAALAKSTLAALESNRENRLRSYETLGLCAGAALAILFL